MTSRGLELFLPFWGPLHRNWRGSWREQTSTWETVPLLTILSIEDPPINNLVFTKFPVNAVKPTLKRLAISLPPRLKEHQPHVRQDEREKSWTQSFVGWKQTTHLYKTLAYTQSQTSFGDPSPWHCPSWHWSPAQQHLAYLTHQKTSTLAQATVTNSAHLENLYGN